MQGACRSPHSSTQLSLASPTLPESGLQPFSERLGRRHSLPHQLPIDGEGGRGYYTVLHSDLGMLHEVHLTHADRRMHLLQVRDHLQGHRLGPRTARSARRREQLDIHHTRLLSTRCPRLPGRQSAAHHDTVNL